MQLSWYPDWAAIFGHAAPLIVEIGFGNGIFLTDLARQTPEDNFLGVERAHSPLMWTEKRVARLGLGNVRLVNGEALMCLRCLLEPASVQTFHINFSDPWHKVRHHRRRLLDEEFMAGLVSRLATGGHVHIATDIEQYAGQIGVALSRTKGLRNAYPSPWMTSRENPSLATHYELKAREEGRGCYYFKWGRTAEAVPHPPIILEEPPMPNAFLHLPLSLDEITAAYRPMSARHVDRVANFKFLFRQTDEPRLLFEVHVEEDLFSQRLLLMLEERTAGQYLLQMSPIGFPRATRGVHDAVYTLMTWLCGLHPDGHVLEHKVKAPD